MAVVKMDREGTPIWPLNFEPDMFYNIQFEGSKPATNSRGIALPFTRSGSSTHAMLRPSPSPRLGWT